jgi:hypothetical protein
MIIVKKKDASIWRKCNGFLPKDFDKTLKLLRKDDKNRLKRLGII